MKYLSTADKRARETQRALARITDADLHAAACDYFTLVLAKRRGKPVRKERLVELVSTVRLLALEYSDAAATAALRAALTDETKRGRTEGRPTENPARLRKLAAEAVHHAG